jgi:hypothetical protein
MKGKFWIFASAVSLIVTASIHTMAQSVPKIAIYNGRTFIAARINVLVDLPPINNQAFNWIPLLTLKAGDKLMARGVIQDGENEMWSVRGHSFTLGGHSINYPAFGIMTYTSTGNTTIVSSSTTIKLHLRPGEEFQSSGYILKTDRALEEGMSIPTLRIINGGGEYIVSIEAGPQGTEPFLTIAHKSGSSGNHQAAMEAWQKTNKSMEMGFPPIYRGP